MRRWRAPRGGRTRRCRRDLVALLQVPEGRRVSELERLRRPPTRTTGASMAKALERVDEISAFRLGRVRLDKVPPNRLATMARVGLGSKAPILERTPEPKRTALLFRALNRRDVFASPSNRWADPRARLLDGKRWEAVAEDVLHGLSLVEPVEEHLAGRVRALDAAWQLMAERLEEAGQDAKLSFEIQPNGRLKLNVDRLGALGEPKSLRWLRSTTTAMLPKIDLPDLLFEVDSWTGFLDAFVHLGDGRTRMENLKTSLVALLVAEACNIGLIPVINPDDEALTRGRLVHVDQYYLRADTIAAANAALIEAQGRVPIVEHWGEGPARFR
jgi:Tn3 transposase DDE domain